MSDRCGSETLPAQILVVDDTPASLQLMTDSLEEGGYRVRSALSGRLALRSVAIEAPDLILLDVKMPDMDGYELCRRLKSDKAFMSIPILFVSALDEAADKVTGFNAGGEDFITKPFQAAEILARVETHLSLRYLQKQLEDQNIQLQLGIAKYEQAEKELQKLNEVLEQKVEERTAALHRSQYLLQSIVNNAIAVIYVKDIEGRYLLINRRFEELFHVSREDILGKTDFDIFPKEMAEVFQAFDHKVIVAGSSLEAEEVAPHDDGPHTYISIKSPLYDADGRPYAVCGISTDITGRKRNEQEIRRLNAELMQKMEQLQNAQEELIRKEKLSILGQLAGTVSHELRNPLGVMNNAVYFLKMVLTGANETIGEYLEILKKEIEKSQRIITDLLDFARTKAPQVKTVAVSELVRGCAGKCSFPENVAFIANIADDLPDLCIDPLQIGQVMLNLFTNGIQAMPEGGKLTVDARLIEISLPSDNGNDPERKRWIEITVTDTGVGISPEGMKRLFQPLFTTKPKGVGLGLTVCKNLTEANGGKIEVTSQVGKGTVFSLKLPVGERRMA